MKKIIYMTAMVAALAACMQEDFKPVTPKDGTTFSLAADIVATKTSLDGRKVSWEDGDVLYMVTTDGTWGAPGSSVAEFAYSASDGRFRSGAAIPDGNYTFNVLYSAGAGKELHLSNGTVNTLPAVQYQDCNNPTAHVKYADALAGTFNFTMPVTSECPSVSMSHVYTLMRVDLTNDTGSDKTFVQLDMRAPGAVVAGKFNINFENAAATSVSSGSNVISVSLSNGFVAAGSGIPVYFVMAPLTGYSGEITLCAIDSDGNTYSRSLDLTGLKFEKGALNTTSYHVSAADENMPVIARSGWSIAYCNSQLLNIEGWNVNPTRLLDGDLWTDWVSNSEGEPSGADDYDYDDSYRFRELFKVPTSFEGVRNIGDVLIVIDFGKEIDVKQIGMAHDVNVNISECEFELASEFSFTADGDVANYNTLAKNAKWTPLMTAAVPWKAKGELFWLNAPKSVKGRYLKIRPTKTRGHSPTAMGITEVYVRGVEGADSGAEMMSRDNFRCAYCNTLETWEWPAYFPASLFDGNYSTAWVTPYNIKRPEKGWINEYSGVADDYYNYGIVDYGWHDWKQGDWHPFQFNTYVPDILMVIDLGETVKVKSIGVAHDVNARLRECEFSVASEFNFKTARDVKNAGGSEAEIEAAVDNYYTLEQDNDWKSLMTIAVTSADKNVVHWFDAETAVEGRYILMRPTELDGSDCAVGLSEFYVKKLLD